MIIYFLIMQINPLLGRKRNQTLQVYSLGANFTGLIQVCLLFRDTKLNSSTPKRKIYLHQILKVFACEVYKINVMLAFIIFISGKHFKMQVPP